MSTQPAYVKTVESADGQVYAHVYRVSDGRRVGFDSWAPWFWECWWPSASALKSRLDAANKWADEYAAVCASGEQVGQPVEPVREYCDGVTSL